MVATEQDILNAREFIYEYRQAGWYGDVYLMPVGGTTESYQLNEKSVAELAMKYGYKYTPRLQVQLWKNAWNT